MGVYFFVGYGNNLSILTTGYTHDFIRDKVVVGGRTAFGLPYRLESFSRFDSSSNLIHVQNEPSFFCILLNLP
jgi:hypothetical protein